MATLESGTVGRTGGSLVLKRAKGCGMRPFFVLKSGFHFLICKKDAKKTESSIHSGGQDLQNVVRSCPHPLPSEWGSVGVDWGVIWELDDVQTGGRDPHRTGNDRAEPGTP